MGKEDVPCLHVEVDNNPSPTEVDQEQARPFDGDDVTYTPVRGEDIPGTPEDGNKSADTPELVGEEDARLYDGDISAVTPKLVGEDSTSTPEVEVEEDDTCQQVSVDYNSSSTEVNEQQVRPHDVGNNAC